MVEKNNNYGKLYLLSGISGIGKSTFAAALASKNNNLKIVSRDEIRFRYLKDGEPYFAHEDEVYIEFCKEINEYLKQGYDVIADQTNITIKSRAKLINKITACAELNCLYFTGAVALALEHNEHRYGCAYVPKEIIQNMYNHFEPPTYDEGFDKIYVKRVTE